MTARAPKLRQIAPNAAAAKARTKATPTPWEAPIGERQALYWAKVTLEVATEACAGPGSLSERLRKANETLTPARALFALASERAERSEFSGVLHSIYAAKGEEQVKAIFAAYRAALKLTAENYHPVDEVIGYLEALRLTPLAQAPWVVRFTRPLTFVERRWASRRIHEIAFALGGALAHDGLGG